MIQDKTIFTIAPETLASLTQEVLQKNGIFRAQVKGNCIYPLVRDRDFLYIRAIPLSQAKIGDIVVYRISDGCMHIYPFYRRPKKNDTRVFLGKAVAMERDDAYIDLEGKKARMRNIALTFLYIIKRIFRKYKDEHADAS